MATNFADLVGKQASEIEKPKPLPIGSYTCMIEKFEFGESQKKSTPYCRFHFRVVSAGEDVDPVELSAVKDYTKTKLRNDFWLTDDSMYRLKDFLQKTLDIDLSGRTIGEGLAEVQGKMVLVNVKHALSQGNEGDIRPEIAGIAKAA